MLDGGVHCSDVGGQLKVHEGKLDLQYVSEILSKKNQQKLDNDVMVMFKFVRKSPPPILFLHSDVLLSSITSKSHWVSRTLKNAQLVFFITPITEMLTILY